MDYSVGFGSLSLIVTYTFEYSAQKNTRMAFRGKCGSVVQLGKGGDVVVNCSHWSDWIVSERFVLRTHIASSVVNATFSIVLYNSFKREL